MGHRRRQAQQGQRRGPREHQVPDRARERARAGEPRPLPRGAQAPVGGGVGAGGAGAGDRQQLRPRQPLGRRGPAADARAHPEARAGATAGVGVRRDARAHAGAARAGADAFGAPAGADLDEVGRHQPGADPGHARSLGRRERRVRRELPRQARRLGQPERRHVPGGARPRHLREPAVLQGARPEHAHHRPRVAPEASGVRRAAAQDLLRAERRHQRDREPGEDARQGADRRGQPGAQRQSPCSARWTRSRWPTA